MHRQFGFEKGVMELQGIKGNKEIKIKVKIKGTEHFSPKEKRRKGTEHFPLSRRGISKARIGLG
jgi:hypothetical protein